jgi:heme/copper-type cytochrome/quinol oxidase subunit 2
MNVLIILAIFYVAVLLVNNYTASSTDSTTAKVTASTHRLAINILVVAGLVLAILACFGIRVIPAMEWR